MVDTQMLLQPRARTGNLAERAIGKHAALLVPIALHGIAAPVAMKGSGHHPE